MQLLKVTRGLQVDRRWEAIKNIYARNWDQQPQRVLIN